MPHRLATVLECRGALGRNNVDRILVKQASRVLLLSAVEEVAVYEHMHHLRRDFTQEQGDHGPKASRVIYALVSDAPAITR
jgi:hypothetical protein